MGLRKFARTRKGGSESIQNSDLNKQKASYNDFVIMDRYETGRQILEDLKYKIPKRTLKNRLHHFYQKLPNVSGRTRRFFQPKLQRQFENLEELEPAKTPTWRKLYRRLFGTKPSNGNKL
jgi:hypothetical protein